MIDPRAPDFENVPGSKLRPPFGYAPESNRPPLVSFLTPFHNDGEIFDETAKAVFGQSLQQFEWLIVNDGSTEPRSLEILDRYRDLDPRVRVIDHDRNRGLGAARNTGFREASTPRVLTLDSDDLLEPTAAEKFMWFLESYPECGFVNGRMVSFAGQTYLWTKGFDQAEQFLQENQVAQTAMIRTSVHQAVHGYDESVPIPGLEDWDFWLRCADAGHWGVTVDEFLFWYRRSPPHNDRFGFQGRVPEFRRILRNRYPRLRAFPFALGPADPPITEAYVAPIGSPGENRLRKERPRLLMLVPHLIVGGAEKFDLDVIDGLVRRGWEVSVVSTLAGDDPWLPEFARLTPDIFRLHSFLATKDYARFISYLIDSRRPDAIHIANSQLAYQLLPHIASRHPDVPVLDLVHAEQPEWRNGGYPRFSIDYQDQIDLTVVTSEHLKRWMTEHGAKGPLEVVYTGADTTRWAPDEEVRRRVREGLGLKRRDLPVILYAGRLCPQKQPRVFARVIQELDRRGLAFSAWVAGDGEDGPWIEEFVKKNGLESKVLFHGAVSVDRMRELMAAADIFFLPSAWEGIALTVFEAMASGCAVVAADVRGQRELVTESTGILAPRSTESREVENYVQEIETLLGDATKMLAMGEEARRHVTASFPIERMHEHLASCIDMARANHLATPSRKIDEGVTSGQVLLALREARYLRQRALRSRKGDEDEVAIAYRAIVRLTAPLYRYALRRHWGWAPRLKDTVKRVIVFRRLRDRPTNR